MSFLMVLYKSGIEVKPGKFQSEKTAWHALIIECILIFIRDPIMWESHRDLICWLEKKTLDGIFMKFTLLTKIYVNKQVQG